MTPHRQPLRILGHLLAALLLPLSSASAERLLVVLSDDALAYRQALAGMGQPGLTVDALPLAGGNEPAARAALARAGRGTAIVALGDRAAAVAEHGLPAGPPMVRCMISAGESSRAGPEPAPAPATVTLDIPLEALALRIRQLLPNARSIGILFDPSQNGHRASDGAAVLTRAGYVVQLEPVTSPAALPSVLNRLAKHVDTVLAFRDTTVFAREHSRARLLFSFRNRIPLVGPTEAWVEAGSLFAVEWDYEDLGRYCGALATRLLPGSRAPVPPPPRMRIVANLNSAEQLRIRWDAEQLRSFDRVFE